MMYEPQPFYEAGSQGPAVTFGAVDTHNAAQVQARAEFERKYGYYPPRNLEEANWLNDRVGAIKATERVDQVIRIDEGVEVHATGRTPRGFNLTSPVVLAGAAGVGLLLLAGGRRRNPRRRARLTPLLLLGGVAAALWYGGKKTLEAAETALTPEAEAGLPPA